MRKQFIIALSIFFIIILIYYVFLLSPVSQSSEKINFLIDAGSGINEIALLLKNKNLIRSETAFKVYSFLTGSAHMLKPGNYSLASTLGTPEIVGILIQGPETLEVLITEGKSVKGIENQLVSLGLLKKGELVNFPVKELEHKYSFLKNKKSLEGFLFPDTYRFFPDSSINIILEKFLDNFEKKALPLLTSNSNEFNYDDLIIASLIEREIPEKEDRRLVSGILRKRLKIGMALQVDATVTYIKCGNNFENCDPLTKNDFRVKSLYNTYYYKGLPPTPIANSGLDAVLASLQPRPSEFLYYLSDPRTKKTIFSRTLEEHNKKRARYLHL